MHWRKIGLSALLLAFALQAHSKEKVDASGTFAVRAGTIYTLSIEGDAPGLVLKNGMMVIENGKVKAFGTDLDVPEGVPVLDFSNDVIVPGFIAADTLLVRPRGGKESVSAKYRSLDGFDMFRDYKQVLAGGVTTAYLNPGVNRLVSGVGSVVKLAGPPGPSRVLKNGRDLCINLGESAFNTPPLQEYPLPASSTNEIPPGKVQRPKSRLGQYIEIKEVLAKAKAYGKGGDFDYNTECLAAALRENSLLRIRATRATDMEGACRLLDELGMQGILSGGLEAHRVLETLKASGRAVVLEVPVSLNRPAADKGFKKDLPDDCIETAARLSAAGIPFALTPALGGSVSDLMMVAATAVRGGLCPMKALEAITRTPAEILGVANRVGSLTPGKDADFLVLSGEPLKVRTHVLKVFTSGREVFTHPASKSSFVVRAGHIFTAAGSALFHGEILVEKGKIAAVGSSVPHPPGARVLDAGPDAVITPGFIDGHGHLGLEGDATSPSTDLSLVSAIVTPGLHFKEVAASGVTSVILAPRSVPSKGAQICAIKPAGECRAGLVVDDLAGLKFTFRGKDPVLGARSLQSALKAGKTYADSWIKYYEELKKWEEAQAKKGEEASKPVEEKAQAETKKETGDEPEPEVQKADPITGTWEYEAAGGRRPEPMTGGMKLKLEGSSITGSIEFSFGRRGGGDGAEISVAGTLQDKQITLELDMESPMGKPTITAELDADDHMIGKLVFGQYMNLDFTATRTQKEEPVVKVTARKKTKEGGRPEPPPLNKALEPYRRLMAGEIPALVDAGTAGEIEKVIQIFVDKYKVPLALLGGEEAYKVADRIRKAEVSVVVPATVLSQKDGKPFVLADALARKGIPVIFQSGAEDGARTLPLNAGYFVHKGMSAGAVLEALTINPARLYRVADRIGSLERGKDADFIIFSGDPFEIGSRVLHVFSCGREVRQ